MSTFTQILYQLVFSTKNRKPCLTKGNRKKLHQYFYGVMKGKKCHVYRINGVEDHTHFIFSLHPSVSLSSLVKDIKQAGTFIIKEEKLFPAFEGWQAGYGAFTYSIEAKDNLIEYVKNQELHHRKTNFREEFKKLLRDHGIEFEEKYLF